MPLASSNNLASPAVESVRPGGINIRGRRVICIHCGDVYSYPLFRESSLECFCLRPGCDGSPLDVSSAPSVMRQNGIRSEQELADYFGGRVLGRKESPLLVGRDPSEGPQKPTEAKTDASTSSKSPEGGV